MFLPFQVELFVSSLTYFLYENAQKTQKTEMGGWLVTLWIQVLSSKRTKCPVDTVSCLSLCNYQSSIWVNHECLGAIHLEQEWRHGARILFFILSCDTPFFFVAFLGVFSNLCLCLNSVVGPFCLLKRYRCIKGKRKEVHGFSPSLMAPFRALLINRMNESNWGKWRSGIYWPGMSQ